MSCRSLLSHVAGWLLVFAAAGPLQAAPRPLVARTSANKAEVVQGPKLLVFLVVDQMRADYVDRFQHQWKHGLRRLMDKGAWFRQAAYPYLGTVTCPGHATLGTGTYPTTHGMILNDWYDREAKKSVACTDDGSTTLISYGGKVSKTTGDSARNLRVPTLADEMRVQLWPVPRVVAFSMKARAAINMSGHKSDVAVWFEGNNWVTSAALAPGPAPFLQKFLAANPMAEELDKPWTKLLPERSYLYEDDAPAEHFPTGWTRTFPHPSRVPLAAGATAPATPSLALWTHTPSADRYLARMARAAVADLGLGKGAGTDYLAVSFSLLDVVGHDFGPRSHEVQDALANLDVTLGDLFSDLDKQVGAGNYVVALSADHGVAPYPEQLTAEGLDAGRVLNVSQKTEEAITQQLGPGKYVSAVKYTDIYLAPGVMERLRRAPLSLAAVKQSLRAIPGVAKVYDTDELASHLPSTDTTRLAGELSHVPGRSGDLIIAPKVHWINSGPGGTTHGSDNDYDQRVPLFLMGASIKAGHYLRHVSPADIAPTLGLLVGVTLPRAAGAPLFEALTR